MIRDRWRDIRAAIEQDIMDGVLEPGARLPTEPELVRVYGAGRHSIRRAVAELAKEGYLSVEQGRGTFVHPRPMLDYTIGPRTRLRRNLGAQGVSVTGEALGVERIGATERVAQRLGLSPGALVIASRRLSLADDVPVSFGTIYHDAARFPDFPERRQKLGSITAVYASYNITDYLRDSTRIYARPARPEEARQLRQHPDMPVIVVRAVDKDMDDAALSYSEVIWSAARVKFNIPNNEDT
ncbi:phosphonate metabolism transcriptional regulator PhnF [Yoonia sp.]|uniref:phosphonate metabolism transcriptional regulator PhnF n=1 Tax=Yoonia sp. TaxID=2212373 RepID=UPI00391B35E6